MNHLIIGAGRMGKLRASVLAELGHATTLIDIGYRLSPKEQFDSVIIETPPETHYNCIIDVVVTYGSKMPLFVDKPVIVQPRRLPVFLKSLVGSNWRWHPKLMRYEWKTLDWAYPNPHPLDLIHFVDVAWERWGKPRDAIYADGSLALKYEHGWKEISIQDGPPKREVDGNEIEVGDMFELEMKHWLNVISGKEESVNDFNKA